MNAFAEFIIVHGQGLYTPDAYKKLFYVTNKHKAYNTLTVLEDEQGIYAIARFNIEDTVARVMDVVIRPDKRNKRVLKELIKQSWAKFPSLTHIRFERGMRANSQMRLISLKKLKEK